MFKNIQAGVEVYRKELHEYLKRLKELKKKYGTENVLAWGNIDYNYVMRVSAGLNAMERALGLSKKESKRIEEEIKSSL